MKHQSKLIIIFGLLLYVLLFPLLYGCAQIKKAAQSETFKAKPVWVFETTENITSTPSTDQNGQVYIRALNSITALNVLSGQVLWKAVSPSNTPLNISPQVSGNYLIVPEKGSRIAVFDTHTGKLQWRTPEIDPIFTHPSAVEIEAISVSNQMAYVARFNWKLTAYRLTDGKIVWEQDTFGRTNPYVMSDQKTVYLGMGSMLKAFDSLSGVLSWQKEFDAYIGPMLRSDNMLYILDEMHSSLYAIDLNTEDILWNTSYPEAEEFEFNCLSEDGDKLLIAGQELIAVTKSSGQIVWATSKLGRLECPAMLNNEIYIRNITNLLYILDSVTGKELGMIEVSLNSRLKHEPQRSPVSTEGLLIVPITDNKVIAYQP
jgi:outer membrane protein assembly factor BamB